LGGERFKDYLPTLMLSPDLRTRIQKNNAATSPNSANLFLSIRWLRDSLRSTT
jgi:hypothetical protein